MTQLDLVGRWLVGVPVDQIAADTGLPPAAIQERLITAGTLAPPRTYFLVGSPSDPLPEHLLREWYVRAHLTVEQIAALTGMTARQVRYRLTRYRLAPGRPGPAPQIRHRLTKTVLTRLYVQRHQSCPAIAAHAGVSTEAVRALLAANDIARRPSGSRSQPPLPAEAITRYRHGTVTLTALATELGWYTSSGNPAVRRLHAALAAANARRRTARDTSTPAANNSVIPPEASRNSSPSDDVC
ncbi:hypothetical protein OWR29_37770 [Actinoplanes sp. Pm04-4]|uniref:Uncharacterized protein n=1 Tax=Paractinoplanes pyxinae TaxID=2997416 RepID=A0ABT4BB77_9ACTN|nr:hypothetical protein [Actinoplanes pyxinae]MCY1143782.1 hypothetical protein [Actinoplanes pyxinae]